jgi:predicted nucleotidyltransferase
MVRYVNCWSTQCSKPLWASRLHSLVLVPGRLYLPPMTPTVTSIRDKVVPILRDRGILRAGIFGSFAKGEEEPGSDLDLLVELPPGSSLFDLVGLQLDLADRLGIEVDAHTYRSLHPLLRDRILGEEVRIL